MWKDGVTIKYEILSHNLPEETEENHKTSVRIADVWLEV
jgi:hypothetical protein